MKGFIKQTGKLSFIIFIIFSVWMTIKITSGYYAPTANPTGTNDTGPIHSGSEDQNRFGDFKMSGTLHTFMVSPNDAIFYGNVGIGTTTPPEKLTLEGGNFFIENGTIDSPSASIGNISVTGAGASANVSNDASIGNNLYVGNGLNVGTGGINTSGDFGVSNTTDATGGLIIETRINDPICNAYATGRIWLRTDIAVALPDIGLRACDGTNVITISTETSSISPLRIIKSGVVYGIILVPTSDPNASKIRINTSSELKALKKI